LPGILSEYIGIESKGFWSNGVGNLLPLFMSCFNPWQTSSSAYGHHAVVDAQEKRYKLIKCQCASDAKLAAEMQAAEWQQTEKLLRTVAQRPGEMIARPKGVDMPNAEEVN